MTVEGDQLEHRLMRMLRLTRMQLMPQVELTGPLTFRMCWKTSLLMLKATSLPISSSIMSNSRGTTGVTSGLVAPAILDGGPHAARMDGPH